MSKRSFEERSTEAMETIASAMEKISATNDAVVASQKQLNDNFLLHQEKSEKAHELLCQATTGVKSEIQNIRDDFRATVYPLIKWMVVALIIIAGGAEAVKILGIA